MSELAEELDYFSDYSILRSPFQYFDRLRERGPAAWLEDRQLVMVTGFQECLDILGNDQDFSPVVSNPGACLEPLPFTPEGDDITAQLEAHRHEIPQSDLMTGLEGERHRASRSLISSLFTPSRLASNEAFMKGLARKLVEEAVAQGDCELIRGLSVPFVTLVIADLLGVPDEDQQKFRQVMDANAMTGAIDGTRTADVPDPMEFMAGYFYRYVVERRANPQDDILTILATQKYPDGSTPEVADLVTTAIFVFGAGGDTTTKLIGAAVRYLVEDPELQRRLRDDRSLIPFFLEEVLRLEGAVKVLFRLARKTVKIGDLTVKAGTKVVLALAAANRDPQRWGDNVNELQLKRPKVMQHLAFSRGAHTCIGNPLARTEGRVMLNTLFDLTSDITLSEAKHGPLGQHRLDYEPSFLLRGLEQLHVKLVPVA